MTTPAGTITLSDIQTEFGGANPIALGEYYAGGAYVSGSVSGVPASGTISMGDLRSKSAGGGSYSPSLSSTNVNEGGSTTCTVTTTGVANGTTLYWTTGTVSGTINASDFSDAVTSGSFTITSNTGSFSRTLANDTTTEGTESFSLQIRTGSTAGPVVATSATVTINDTSTSAPTYSASWSPSSVSEGGASTITLATTGVPNGTTLWYNITGTASYLDLVGVSSANSSFSTTNNSTANTFYAAYDSSVESAETLTVSYRAASGTGGAVLASANLTINDAMGVVSTFVLTIVGGATAGSNVTIQGQITSIAAYPEARTFAVTYNLNGGAYSNTGLTVTNITVNANATSSALTTLKGPTVAGSTQYTATLKTTLAGHTDKVSNSVVAYL